MCRYRKYAVQKVYVEKVYIVFGVEDLSAAFRDGHHWHHSCDSCPHHVGHLHNLNARRRRDLISLALFWRR